MKKNAKTQHTEAVPPMIELSKFEKLKADYSKLVNDYNELTSTANEYLLSLGWLLSFFRKDAQRILDDKARRKAVDLATDLALDVLHEKDEERLQKEDDAQAFAAYDAAANAALERAGLAPKFRHMALRDLKDHVLSLDDSKDTSDPKKAKKVFAAFAKAFAKKNPELLRRAPKKARAKATSKKRSKRAA